MARDPSFAPPLSELVKSGIGVVPAPTGGMGLALTPDGKLPAGVLFLGTQPRRINCGKDTASLAAANFGDKAVAHGLGVVPVCALAIIAPTGSLIDQFFCLIVAADATNITVRAEARDAGNFTGTADFYWLAIG